jgi:mannose/cellobiose epimerase-like protein (N-acyl-D-glucosamine 2-epimerase family)
MNARVETQLGFMRASLKRWLVEDAFPLWWQRGADRLHGGFHERLQQSGRPIAGEPRRARLLPRQAVAFGMADELGCERVSAAAVELALTFFARHFVRDDWLVRSRVAPDGHIVDDSVLLYDQAFALLGYSIGFGSLQDTSYRVRARDLLDALRAQLLNPAGGFLETRSSTALISSNSHMHLLEAALAWMTIDTDERWRRLASDIVELAMSRFLDTQSAQIVEHFLPDLTRSPTLHGRTVEPGHQFEWAWLLLRWSALSGDERVSRQAIALIDEAELRGIDPGRDVAMNALTIDGAVLDAAARLWPQTERIKAACAAWERTGSAVYCLKAGRAAAALQRYLQTPLPGLWYDRMLVTGQCVDEPAPASSFYHIVAAIAEVDCVLTRLGSVPIA